MHSFRTIKVTFTSSSFSTNLCPTLFLFSENIAFDFGGGGTEGEVRSGGDVEGEGGEG